MLTYDLALLDHGFLPAIEVKRYLPFVDNEKVQRVGSVHSPFSTRSNISDTVPSILHYGQRWTYRKFAPCSATRHLRPLSVSLRSWFRTFGTGLSVTKRFPNCPGDFPPVAAFGMGWTRRGGAKTEVEEGRRVVRCRKTGPGGLGIGGIVVLLPYVICRMHVERLFRRHCRLTVPLSLLSRRIPL